VLNREALDNPVTECSQLEHQVNDLGPKYEVLCENVWTRRLSGESHFPENAWWRIVYGFTPPNSEVLDPTEVKILHDPQEFPSTW
jgi:hypothetical protein